MKLSTVFSGALLAAASVTDAISVPEILAKRQSQTTAITGVQDGSTGRRVELRTMFNQNPDQFNLYLLGLREFMQVDQSDPLSYYQIAGIHGRPYKPWQGWTSSAGANGYGGGYCTHVSNIFATWHRPYLALYEQQLYQHVQNVANSFTTDKARWQKAAQGFRIPYWDWAAQPSCGGCQVYPLLVSNGYTSVTTPSGKQTIVNPLFRYDFHPISANDMVYNPFATWTVTKRYPTNWNADAVSQNNLVASQISSNRASFASRLYNLFTNYNNFTQFSNEAWESSSNVQGADSLESIHDAIHSITGSNGHMTYLDYSAFDPIFWLHHANVDRLWAMWSTIYPNSYVEQANSQGSTYTYPAGTSINANFGLQPFSKDTNRNLFNSQDVRSTTRFNYVYPETAGNNAQTVKTAVNNLYNNNNSNKKKRGSKHKKGKRDASIEYHYVTNIVSQKFALNGSYAVYMFLGEPSDNAAQWPTSPVLAGIHGVAANLADDFNAGMSKMNVPVTGTVPLTPALLQKVQYGQLANMDPATVEPYLQKNLKWRVAKYDGTVIPASNVPDFSVTVVTSEVQPATAADQFPIWQKSAVMANATFGKAGGHNDAWWGTVDNWTLSNAIAQGISTSGRN